MKKKAVIIISLLLAVNLFMWICDFSLVAGRFEKPVFCLLVNGADDGGSGTYIGFGYSFEIKGNFMPEDEYPGVTSYAARILGLPVSEEVRD